MSSLDRILPFLGPIRDLLTDDEITEVMVNAGGQAIFVERRGRLQKVSGRTVPEHYLVAAIKNIARFCGDEISEAQPILDARLEDGSRIAAMFPPCSVAGPVLTIRRFTRRYSLRDLVEIGSVAADAAQVLERAVLHRSNILIAGGTGTGKTTLLNALAAVIPVGDRLVVIEETSEIYLGNRENVLSFEARRARPASHDVPAVDAVTIADLLKATLRHRPDRIVVGEVRGAEAFDLLQALNTGHRGSLTTVHANSAPEALTRVAHCVARGGVGLPHAAVREAIASAIHMVVHITRSDVGTRRVSHILSIEQFDARLERFVTQDAYTLC
ncbi:MAG: ATPase, T2SS/T4P/T4SS family [Acidobacteriota bacterium]